VTKRREAFNDEPVADLGLFRHEGCGEGTDQEEAAEAGYGPEKAAGSVRPRQLIQTEAESTETDDSNSNGLKRCERIAHGTSPSLGKVLL
jgi:hypothetical protein